jgi:membrane protease YdiL (CAAX protease family)
MAREMACGEASLGRYNWVMNDQTDGHQPGDAGGAGARPSRGRVVALWLAVLAACAVIFGVRMLEKSPSEVMPDPEAAPSPMVTFMSRYAIGIADMAGAQAPSAQLADQADGIATSFLDRLRTVPTAGELVGPTAALERLAEVEQELDAAVIGTAPASGSATPSGAGAAGAGTGSGPGTATPLVVEDAKALDALRQDVASLRAIYDAGRGDAINAAERDRLVRRHHWSGRLATTLGADASADPARASVERQATLAVVMVITMVVGVGVAGLTGLVLFVTAMVQLAQGRLRSGLVLMERSGRATPDDGASPTAHLETVALFLWSFVVVMAVAGAAFAATGIDLTALLVWGMALLALWPMARGWSGGAWRRSVGWHSGRGVITEMVAGIAGYVACLPILAVGVAITLVLTMLTGTDASHPIVQQIDTGSPWALAMLYLLACGWAPLVEETVFRGSLYRWLRGGRGVVVSALVTGVIFAIIHPQGIVGVPVLAAMGANFCLIREWRGSIIGAVTAHALNNAVAVTLMVVLMG